VRSIYTFLVLIMMAAGAYSQAVQPTASVEELYLAKDDGNGLAGEQVTEFTTTDVPIFCVVLLDTFEKTTVKMNFVAVNVAGVKADTKVVTASYTTQAGQNRVNFTGRPEGRWTPGKYRVDIILDGKVARNVEFDIKGSGGTGTNTASKFFQPPKTPPKPKPAKRN
jgi:hypothetical protein